MIPFHEESAAPSAPQGLIAYREDGGDVLCWQAVVNAAGYYVYARKNTADDNNYAHFEYERQNQTPLDSCEWVGESREVSYRVTAVDAQGRESGFSSMVFPVRHSGVEVLSLTPLCDGCPLANLPAGNVCLSFTAINSTREAVGIVLRVTADGHTSETAYNLPADGRIHDYAKDIGAVQTGSLAAAVYDKAGRRLSCLLRFCPEGLPLFDTRFEHGVKLCDPKTPTLYHGTGGAWNGAPILGGQQLGNFIIHLDVTEAKGPAQPLHIQHGSALFTLEAGGQMRLSTKKGEATLQWSKTPRQLKIYAMGNMAQVFADNENIPALSLENPGGEQGRVSVCTEGWQVSDVVVESLIPSFAGELYFNGGSDTPVWDIACWHSAYNWIRPEGQDPVQTLPDGSTLVANKARSLWRSKAGNEVVITSLGSVEMTRARRQGEGWPHLLLEVLWNEPGRYPVYHVAALRYLWFAMDIQMLQCENKTNSFNPDYHAGQFVMYFNLRGVQNESLWLGLCNMDSRFLGDENRQEAAFQMDPGTNTFIYAPPLNQFIAGHLADGQTHTISLDLKPVIMDAYAFARERGAFAASRFEDIKLNSMNMGFEIPGNVDMSFRLANMQLAAQ